MQLGQVSPETDQRLALLILNAWKKDGTRDEVPWHITDLGWLAYANHKSAEVRTAALNHPYYGFPSRHLQQRRAEFRLDVRVYS